MSGVRALPLKFDTVRVYADLRAYANGDD